MANSAFDPLRQDPFATVNDENASPVGGSFPVSEGNVGYSQNESPEALMMQFNNSNPVQESTRERINRSDLSSLSSRSLSSRIEDPNFAPPPPPPLKRDYSTSLMMAESGQSELPSFKSVHHSGVVLARISMKSLVTKNWKRVFWIQYGENSILIFRSHDDFEEWVNNPYLSREKREALIKLKIDLNKSDYSPDFLGYRPTHIQPKYYTRSGLLHQFKVDKWLTDGPSIAGAFGSQNEDEVMELYTILTEMIKRNPSCSNFMNLPHDGTASLSSRSYGAYSSSGSVSSRGWSVDDRSVGSKSVNSTGSSRNRGVMTAVARANEKIKETSAKIANRF